MSLVIKTVRYTQEQVVFSVDNLVFNDGIYLLWGVSGSGKTTFIEGLCGQRRGFYPHIQLATENFFFQVRAEREKFFTRFISVHYQLNNLLEELNVRENLLLPMVLVGKRLPEKALWERELSIFGIEHLLSRLPVDLSGGERQRVSLCRSLLYAHKLLLLDEPFVFVEQELQEKLFAHVVQTVTERGLICLLASHEPWLEKKASLIKLNFNAGFCY